MMKPTPAEEHDRLVTMHLHEREVWQAGYRRIGGVDEVGRGPLAGPVVAACVVIEKPLMLEYLNDSKQVTEARRMVLDGAIRQLVVAWAIGSASVAEIDQLNIAGATRLAMQRAVQGCIIAPDALLVDAMKIADFTGPQRALIGGDMVSAAIAAASIIAKVHRDALLLQMDQEDPRYGFARHKGYGTKAHLEALREFGPSIHHRQSFAPVRALLEKL